MKSKLRNLLLAAMALTLFAGCSNIALNDAAVEGSDAGDKCVLTISVDGFTGAGSTIERTISPTKYTANSKTKFVIEGKSVRNVALAPKLLTFTDSEDTKIALDYDVWYLTLHAVEVENEEEVKVDGEISANKVLEKGSEILRGVTTANLSKGVTQISFTLSTKGVNTKGGIDLTAKINSEFKDLVKSYEVGIYEINTDALVADTYIAHDFGDDDYVKDGDTVTGIKDIEIALDELNPGDYIFKFTPYNKKAGEDNRVDLNTWSDVIKIAPGRTTEKTITITGILQPPAAPSDLTATLVTESEEDNDEYFTVHISWEDNSDNENNFVLRLYEYEKKSGATDATKLESFIEKGEPIVFDENLMTYNSYWVDGTLGMSTKSCDIRLRTGHLFDITLTAKNNAGESDVVARAVNSADFPITENTEHEISSIVRINRQKITYNLLGGTRTVSKRDAEGNLINEVDTSTENIVEYKTYGKDDKKLIEISGKDADLTADPKVPADKLIYDGHPFSCWKHLPAPISDNNQKFVSLGDFDYSDFMVYASYDQNVNVDYEVAEEYKTLVITPSVKDDIGAAITNNTLPKVGKTLTISTTKDDGSGNKVSNATVWGETIKFTIGNNFVDPNPDDDVDPEATPTTFDKVILIVNGKVVGSRANAKSYEYSLNNFRLSGEYNIVVIGEIDGRYYSAADPITLTVDIEY